MGDGLVSVHVADVVNV
jgi:hypothetical protein